MRGEVNYLVISVPYPQFMISVNALREDWERISRVVFYDRALENGWTEEPEAVADTLQQFGGYRSADSAELASWLAARARAGASGTLLINTQGDSIPAGGLRAYMDAGGRLVWCGSGPSFLNLGLSGKPPEPLTRTPPEATPEGVVFGLRPGPRGGDGFLNAGKGCTALAGVKGWASIFLLRFLPDKPGGSLLRFASHFSSVCATWEDVRELIRVAEHGLDLGKPPAREEEDLPAGAGAKAAPALPEAPGVLVESGVFRIDRGAALRKLTQYQLGDDAPFLLPWARAAAACCAREVEARTGFSFVELSFDGEPFPAKWAENPFDALFNDEPGGEAARQAAFGILGALKHRPARVILESGRTRLVVSSPEVSSAAALPSPASRTLLRAVWSGPRPGWPLRHVALERLAGACAIAPFLLRVNGRAAPRPAAGGMESVSFDLPGARGVIFAQRNGWSHSRLGIHRLGVRVCEIEKWSWPALVDGDVEAPGLSLNLSQSGVVRDAAFDRMMADLTAPMFQLMDRVLEGHSPEFRRAAELVRDSVAERRLWCGLTAPRQQPPRSAAMPAFERARGFLRRAAWAGGARTVEAAARPIWWLRRCSYGIPGDKPLMDAPLWFSADGGTLSRRRLEAIADELGYIPSASAWYPGHPRARDVLLLVSEGDRRLSNDLYRRRVMAVDAELEAGKSLKDRRGNSDRII